MERTERPLRFTVEKWLAMAHAMSARITRGSRARSNQARSVCIEARYQQVRLQFTSSVRPTAPGAFCLLIPNAQRCAFSRCAARWEYLRA